MDYVYKMHVQDSNGVGRTAPCVFSTEEQAFKWARKYNTNPLFWTLQMLLVDNWNEDSVSTNR